MFGRSNSLSINTGGSLFGGTNESAAPQRSNSLFGNPAPTQAPQSTPSLFGSTQPPNTSGSQSNLTGTGAQGTQQQQQQQQPAQPSLFGGQPQFSRSLFNTPGATTLQPQGCLFGGPPPAQPTPMFQTPAQTGPFAGGLSMGQGTQRQQQTVPGVKIDVSNLRGTTRFNDLHEDLQKQIEDIDAFIQKQIGFKTQTDAATASHVENLTYIPNDVDYVTRRVEGVESALDYDSKDIEKIKELVHKDAESAKVSFKDLDVLNLPQQYRNNTMWGGAGSVAARQAGVVGEESEAGPDIVAYISTQADEMQRSLAFYQQTVTEVESHLREIERSTAERGQSLMLAKQRDEGKSTPEDQIRELATVLMDFEKAILSVAGNVGGCREKLQELTLGMMGDSGF